MAATYTFATGVPGSTPIVGARFFIGTKAADAENDAYVQVYGLTSIPPFGPADNPITISTIDYQLDLTEKGSTNPGGGDYMFTALPSDPGQLACAAARADRQGNYNMKLEWANKLSPGGRGTIYTFKGKIMSAQYQGGESSGYHQLKVTVAYNALPTTTAATST